MDRRGMNAARVFAFDFDGTLCDGLNECLLVTWNGYHGLDLGAFGDDGLQNIPATFVTRFQSQRNFAKHLGHFAVSLMTDVPIRTQEQFDLAYDALGEDRVHDFVAKVTHYRHAARQTFRDRWLAYHAFYPGIERFLRARTEPLYVVTAKDAESVHAILAAHGVNIPFQRIFGEQRAKLDALDIVATSEGVAKEQVLFFDDNVFNAIEARRAGYSAHWAGWGYSAPAHFEFASSEGMSPLKLEDLVAAGDGNVHAICASHDSRT